jgi:hypothetical protein
LARVALNPEGERMERMYERQGSADLIKTRETDRNECMREEEGESDVAPMICTQ